MAMDVPRMAEGREANKAVTISHHSTATFTDHPCLGGWDQLFPWRIQVVFVEIDVPNHAFLFDDVYRQQS